MKISIITVSYNSATTIEQTIQSVLSQDYPDLEYWIVDGASTDETVSILEKYKDQIHYISEKDSGIYDAMNKGLDRVSGDIVGIIGSDDYFENTHTLSQVAEAFKNSGADSVYGDVKIVDGKNTEQVVRFWEGGTYKKEHWLKGWMPPHLTFYLKKELYNKYGKFRTDLLNSGDYELMLRMLYKNDVSSHYLSQTLVTMRTGGVSNASLKHRLVANLEDRKAWKLNELKPRWYTLWFKPLSKISQFFKK